jgi:hypothetical protein
MINPSRLRQSGALALRVLLGLAIGVFIHYLLYRLFLPVQPFIYVAF